MDCQGDKFVLKTHGQSFCVFNRTCPMCLCELPAKPDLVEFQQQRWRLAENWPAAVSSKLLFCRKNGDASRVWDKVLRCHSKKLWGQSALPASECRWACLVGWNPGARGGGGLDVGSKCGGRGAKCPFYICRRWQVTVCCVCVAQSTPWNAIWVKNVFKVCWNSHFCKAFLFSHVRIFHLQW